MISDIKLEILKTIPTDSCCSYSFLNALFSNVKINYSKNQINAEIPIFMQDKVCAIIKNFYPNLTIILSKDEITLNGFEVEQLFLDCGVVNSNNFTSIEIDGINEEMLKSECCKITYLKTIYLCVGNFYYNKNNNENSNGYSVEFLFKNFALADDCKALMKFMKLKVGTSKRGNGVIVYMRDSESIYDLFVNMNAVETAIEIQNNLLIREMRNDANRQGNCFDANLNKTINASREQVKAIDYIITNFGIDYLDVNLQETALLRLANEDITLQEMQKLYSVPISRAGLKYKLDKIIKIYKDLIVE